MISSELRIERFSPRQLTNLMHLFDPPAGSGRQRPALRWLDRVTDSARGDDEEPAWRPPLVVLTRGEVPLRVFELGGRTLPVTELRGRGRAALQELRRRRGAAFAVAVDCAALPRLADEVQRAAGAPGGQDPVARALAALRVLQRRVGHGWQIDPRLLAAVPLPPYELLQRTFDRVLPDGRAFCYYVFDREPPLWTSLIAVKQRGSITRITSHRAIGHRVQPSSPRDAGAITAAVAAELAPVHIGIFLPLGVWHRFVGGDRAAIAAAIAARRAVLDPCPPWLLAVVGAGAMTEAAQRSARLASKLLARAPVGGRLLRGGAEMVQRMANPLEAVGLDPWELVRWSHGWARRVLPLVEPPPR